MLQGVGAYVLLLFASSDELVERGAKVRKNEHNVSVSLEVAQKLDDVWMMQFIQNLYLVMDSLHFLIRAFIQNLLLDQLQSVGASIFDELSYITNLSLIYYLSLFDIFNADGHAFALLRLSHFR